eukprot:5018164-Amphidinium_carterae.1
MRFHSDGWEEPGSSSAGAAPSASAPAAQLRVPGRLLFASSVCFECKAPEAVHDFAVDLIASSD